MTVAATSERLFFKRAVRHGPYPCEQNLDKMQSQRQGGVCLHCKVFVCIRQEVGCWSGDGCRVGTGVLDTLSQSWATAGEMSLQRRNNFGVRVLYLSWCR